ncbi:MAG: hypothetical protein COB49_12650 [Alphaproteobacteria bacterium]|nr:MAG: hypothetical protein COB49_12650 [Alphaproteobacteria bacterium]
MTKQKNNARQPLVSLYRTFDDIVLSSMPLLEDTERDNLSKFGDDHWDMAPAMFKTRARQRNRVVDFTTISCPMERLVAKEYIYASLNERLTGRVSLMRPGFAGRAKHYLQRFMNFVRDRLGVFDVEMVDQELIDAFRLGLLSEINGSPHQIATYLKPIVELRHLGPYLTCGGLNFLPWSGRSLANVAGIQYRAQENLTPRIPEPVISGLLHWALKYIDLFSTDIFAARAEWNALVDRFANRQRPNLDVLGTVTAWIEARRKMGRGIPVWHSPDKFCANPKVSLQSGKFKGELLNMRLITHQAGFNLTSYHENAEARRRLHMVINEMGIERGGMDTPISIDPDTGQPWRDRFDLKSILREEKNLQAAAYVLCAYFSGMRRGELNAMAPDCVVRSQSADGMVERIVIKSTLYKGCGVRGEPEEWVTIEPVASAVAIAERLAAEYRQEHHGDGLWIVLTKNKKIKCRGIPHILTQINRFRDTLNDRYGTQQEPVIPLVDGQPWSFTTRQFRRTVAWYIANRPFGVVAGKIQYKHASVAMFQGYSGKMSGFRQEVEQERVIGQLDDIVEQYEAHRRGERQAGPAAPRLAAEYDHVDRKLAPLPGRIADRGLVKAMLGHLARTLHVGYLNDCFFEPATALCLNIVDEHERDTPVLSRCAPDRCPNACISSRHLPVWEASIAEADNLLKDKRLSRFQREALQQDNKRKRKLIAPLKEGGSS